MHCITYTYILYIHTYIQTDNSATLIMFTQLAIKINIITDKKVRSINWLSSHCILLHSFK